MPAYAGAATPDGDARDDLELDPGRPAGLGLLAAAAEHERVAALEPHDAEPPLRALDQLVVDPSCGHRDVARRLADVDELGVLARAVERAARDQAVVEDRVGARDQLERAGGHQARIAGPGADEIDDARARAHCAHASFARSRISPAPAPSMRSASATPSAAGCSGSPRTASRTHSEPSGRPA